MDFEISRREVLNNLIRFKDSLLDLKEGDQVVGSKRSYSVLLNSKTGDMHFVKKISYLASQVLKEPRKKETPEDWKKVQIIVSQSSATDKPRFEILDNENDALTPKGLEPLAWKVASETVALLNQKSAQIPKIATETLPEKEVLKDLSSIHISVNLKKIEDLPGWMGFLSRLEAEEILQNHSTGTYLLREGDDLTVSIVFHVSEENALSIRPYLLTVVESPGKISDILLLETNQGWTCYHDDPNLKDKTLYKYFSTPQELLAQFKMIARFPLSGY